MIPGVYIASHESHPEDEYPLITDLHTGEWIVDNEGRWSFEMLYQFTWEWDDGEHILIRKLMLPLELMQ